MYDIPLSTGTSLWVDLAILLAVFCLVIAAEYQVLRRGASSVLMKYLLYLSLIGFLAVYIWLVLLYRSPYSEAKIMLRPLASYKAAFSLEGGLHIQRLSIARQILLNVMVYMPVGLLFPCLFRQRKHPLLLTLLCGFVLSLLTEIVQYVTRLGFGEVDDLIDNTLGCLLGIAAYCLGVRLLRLWWNARGRKGPQA